jgi:hypothetical protein
VVKRLQAVCCFLQKSAGKDYFSQELKILRRKFGTIKLFYVDLQRLNVRKAMKIGDKVRFLNDVGGGTVKSFRQGGIVLVEDEDGFDIPMPQHEVVVIEEEVHKKEEKSTTPKTEPVKKPTQDTTTKQKQEDTKPEGESLKGKEYLLSKTVQKEEEDIDENLEARIVRLEMTIQKLEARIARLEAENNLRKNEQQQARQAKPKSKPQSDKPTTLGDLQIL